MRRIIPLCPADANEPPVAAPQEHAATPLARIAHAATPTTPASLRNSARTTFTAAAAVEKTKPKKRKVTHVVQVLELNIGIR